MRKIFSTRSLAALAIGAFVLAGATASAEARSDPRLGRHGDGPFIGMNKGGDKFGKGPFGGLNKGQGKFGKGPFGQGKFGKGPFGGTILVVGGKRDCHREWRTVFVPGIGLAKAKVRVCH